MRIEELDYDLPHERIATAPSEPRDAARLMVVHRATGQAEHRRVRDLPEYLRPTDLMLFNQTRVLPARFEGVRTNTGGRVRGLYLRSPASQHWLVMLEARGSLRPGERITLTAQASLELAENRGGGEWLASLVGATDTLALLHQIGATPLPPYIVHERKVRHEPQAQPGDEKRYNTVFAADPGSVAAPTAGLHFTPELLQQIDDLGVTRATLTLHVGLGTFQPVRTERVEDHPIHREWVHIAGPTLDALRSARRRGGRIVVVGTTSVRAVESLPPDWDGLRDFTTDTNLFITPDTHTRFRFTDALMTNFHLPRSTLLALVAALPGVGVDNLKRWYATAIAEGYRFYSYGDAMLLL